MKNKYLFAFLILLVVSFSSCDYEKDFDLMAEKAVTGGSDGGTGTGGTQELKNTRVEGNSGGKSYVDFTLTKNAKNLVIKTTELSNADLNMADVFVSRSTTPTVTSNYPYVFKADYSHTSGNRGEKVITIKNAQAGDWHIMLYGFNSYYWSWVIVTVEY